MIKETGIFYVFILLTDSDYSQEVNKMNEHDISNDHSFTTRHFISSYLRFWKKGFLNIPTLTQILHVRFRFRRWFEQHRKVRLDIRWRHLWSCRFIGYECVSGAQVINFSHPPKLELDFYVSVEIFLETSSTHSTNDAINFYNLYREVITVWVGVQKPNA